MSPSATKLMGFFSACSQLLNNNGIYISFFYWLIGTSQHNKIIQEKKNGKQYYTLLGWDGIDEYSTQKIIDVLHFTRNKITFGHPIFIKEKNKDNRVLIEYDERTSVSLSYNKKEKKIIFNNLIPIKKELEGLYEYYVPDGSNNSYNYKSGKWIFEKDIDARNNKNNNSRKKPKMGLLPYR